MKQIFSLLAQIIFMPFWFIIMGFCVFLHLLSCVWWCSGYWLRVSMFLLEKTAWFEANVMGNNYMKK